MSFGIPSDVGQIDVQCDYETGDRCGAGGFQISSISYDDGEEEVDFTDKVDQGIHFMNTDELAKYLNVPASIIEEV
ncbi:MAG: hypothetical protein FWC09_03705 [Lachnospiraceae bacterium]|nr:hypothetical protein [Lachnospiraceae bacterium]